MADQESNVSKFEKVITEKSIFITNLLRSQKLADVMIKFRKKLIRQNLEGIRNYVKTMAESYNRLAGKFDVDTEGITMIGGLLNVYKDYGPFIAIIKKRPKSISEMLSLAIKQDFKSLDKQKIVLLALPLLAFNKLMTKVNSLPIDTRYQIYNLFLDTSGVFAPTSIKTPENKNIT